MPQITHFWTKYFILFTHKGTRFELSEKSEHRKKSWVQDNRSFTIDSGGVFQLCPVVHDVSVHFLLLHFVIKC